MKLGTSALARARYLALILPLFALFSTVQAACSTSPSGYYYGNRRAPESSSGGSDCSDETAYGNYAGYGNYGGYGNSSGDGNCDDNGGYRP